MLQSVNRLSKVRDFNLIIKHGRWTNGQFLDLKVLDLNRTNYLLPKREDPFVFKQQLRIAFAVGLKISKSAVVRNRLKRQVREVVRLLLKEKKIRGGYYLLFVAKKNALEKEYLEIKKEVEMLLRRAGLL